MKQFKAIDLDFDNMLMDQRILKELREYPELEKDLASISDTRELRSPFREQILALLRRSDS